MERKVHRKCSVKQEPSQPTVWLASYSLLASVTMLSVTTYWNQIGYATLTARLLARTLLAHELQVEETDSWELRSPSGRIPPLPLPWLVESQPISFCCFSLSWGSMLAMRSGRCGGRNFSRTSVLRVSGISTT